MEWAGIIGVIPWSFTLRELHMMMIAKQRADWERSSLLIAAVKNIFVSNKKDIIQPDDINPYSKKNKKKNKKSTQAVKNEKPLKVSKSFMINVFGKRYGKRGKNQSR